MSEINNSSLSECKNYIDNNFDCFLQDYINYVNSGKDGFYVTEDENLAYLEFLEKLEKGEIKDND